MSFLLFDLIGGWTSPGIRIVVLEKSTFPIRLIDFLKLREREARVDGKKKIGYLSQTRQHHSQEAE